MESSVSSQQFTNKLIAETSPYLLQHAHNPVDWYPWGDEAFERARAEDKPVIVSIGYSACHWCHVMEHESFEDEAVAAVMNEHFINVKVDMEERPDVDQIYMNFVQMTTGRGGWPMNVFLTPDKRPFYGGTYFPPQPRYGMPSWHQILISIAEAYREKRDELEESANRIVAELNRLSTAEIIPGGVSADLLETAFNSFTRTFDTVNGGFGGAPKFPPAMSLEFLLRYHKRTGDGKALAIVEYTLGKMARGGIYDQLGGGFHRYAVDAIWLVPHFEKMLYDNAQLIRVYLHAFQVTGNEFYKRIAVETLEYVRREMLDASGGFYSTQDADSEGEEGKFFVWTPEEIAEILGKGNAEAFCSYYDVTASGNFEGHNILNIKDKVAVPSRPDALDEWRTKLFAEREKRIKPGRDEKVLTAWNGLMLAAFADAAAVLGDEDYLAIAKQNADFILEELQVDGRLLRTWKDGKAKLNGYVEDHANVADGLIVLFQATGEVRYLSEARRLADVMITEFWDGDNGGFFFTSNDHEELIVRNKDFYDNATPSGNSVAADVMLRLAKLTGDDMYERFAVTILRLAASNLRRHPQGFGRALSAMEFYLAATKEVVVIGPKGNELERRVLERYLPDAVIVLSDNADADSAVLPLLADRRMTDGQATAYVCENFVCSRPVTKSEDMDIL
ncbi:MAG: thioredoxin domain-containing protein [Pyrinomonadaceae bacterium]|nr:thioredoxin domain-containing protein [Pyrinomonadaceae bacterium]MBP6212536.1 thioredoxin domain-containing protein [Pyrinomonadaceae bacterium]